MKKIAVLVRERQPEAIRMSLGITVMDDTIDVFILDRKLMDDEQMKTNLETLKDLGMNVYTNLKENNEIQYVTTEEIAKMLLDYDNILVY